MPDIDVFIWPALAQQAFPRRRKPSPRRDDRNINILDSLATALHVSIWSSWSQAPPSRRALFAPRLWRFRGQNVSPDIFLGGLVENITIDKYADSRTVGIARLWRNRYTFRNKGHYADRVEELAYVPLQFLSYVAESLPRNGRWARRRAWQKFLGSTSTKQQFIQTQVAATTSFPLGDVHYVGGVLTLGL